LLISDEYNPFNWYNYIIWLKWVTEIRMTRSHRRTTLSLIPRHRYDYPTKGMNMLLTFSDYWPWMLLHFCINILSSTTSYHDTHCLYICRIRKIQTQKDIRKQRKENEALQKILKAEQKARAEVCRSLNSIRSSSNGTWIVNKAYEEMARARIAAIKASRGGGGCQTAALTIDRFSITHPSGRACEWV
jgi:hypothetical protein